jgi:hypothetical protein
MHLLLHVYRRHGMEPLQLVFDRMSACDGGTGMCVSLKHGVVILSAKHDMFDDGSQLHVRSLYDGSFVRAIGSKGSGKGQFRYLYGGLCVTPDGDSVLVAEDRNHRVQQVKIVDGSWVRFFGETELERPQCVDCSTDVIAVSEACHRISVLSWADGVVLARFCSYGSGPGELQSPAGLRLLSDGRHVVVCDCINDRLCVFTITGDFVSALCSKEQGLSAPYDVLECTVDDALLVVNAISGTLTLVSRRDGAVVGTYGRHEAGDDEFVEPCAMASLPEGGLVIREREGRRFQVFKGLALRMAWIAVCVKASR